MDSKVERFFERIKGKTVAFCGIGISNMPLIYMFINKGISVIACDRRKKEALGAAAYELQAAGAVLKLGDDYLDNLNADIIFRTPGMYYNMEKLTEYRKKGVIVTSEMEVFFDLCPAHLIAVTGSDGKTTTTTLISEMLKSEGKKVYLGGNIGKALLPEIEKINEDDYAVVELSSFQLISMRKSPDIAVITNVAPNHLDVHKTMDEYIDCKRNLIIHQNAFSRTVLNADNEITRSMTNLVRGDLRTFSRKAPVMRGTFCDENGDIYIAQNNVNTKVMNSADIRLPGNHNIENYLAAISAVEGIVSPDNMRKVAKEFGGVEHRIEFIREIDGVKYYNDSIATSPTRTIAGLNAFNQKLIIIAGGYDKHIPFEPLAPVVNKKVKLLILTGATADKIEKAVTEDKSYEKNNLKILHAKDLEEALRIAKENAIKGDIISLSPACASFDSYPNFEARGLHFKEMVKAL